MAHETVMEHVADLAVVLDARNTSRDFNRAAQTVCGFTQKLSRRDPDILPPQWAELFQRCREHAEAKTEVSVGSGEQRRFYDLTISPIRDRQARTLGRLFLLHDITDRKAIELRLRELSRAVEQSPASIVITDIAGNIEYVNLRFSQLTGYTPEEVTGQNPRLLKSGETPPETFRALWSAWLPARNGEANSSTGRRPANSTANQPSSRPSPTTPGPSRITSR